MNKKSKEIDSVWVQNGHRIYFTATSENLTYLELENLLDLKDTEGFSKGDLRINGNSKHTFSRISFEPIKCEAYELIQLLDILLTELEKNLKKLKNLRKLQM